MADAIGLAAAQVRSLTRNPKVVHKLLATINVPDGGGRAYRTACHYDLPTQHAALTTRPCDCADCEAAP